MALHSFVAYLKYSWKARGRHGTHSPFVYDFVEHVLLDKSVLDQARLLSGTYMELKYENLMTRIATYYHYSNTRYSTDLSLVNEPLEMLVINDDNSAAWLEGLQRHEQWLKNDSAVIVTHIHKTKANSAAWNKITKQPQVRMSIDLFGMGVLFFKQEFKERQHFVLKY